MVARRAVLQGVVGAVAGGVPAPRPDQALQPVSRAGTGPAPQNAFLVNPIIVVTPGKGLFVYSPSPGTGNLIASVAASAGTDPYGNAFQQGIVSYQTGTTFISQLISSTLTLGSTAWTQLAEIDANTAGILHLASPRVTGGDTQINFSLESSSAGGPVAFLSGGPLALPNLTAPASSPGEAQLFGTGGNLAVVGFDTNTYDTQTLHLIAYPNLPITGASFVNVTGASVSVGAQHYRFSCTIDYTTTAVAGASQFQFTSPATTGNVSLDATWVPTITPGNSLARNTVSSLSLGAGLTLNGGGGVVTMQGDATFSASGTLQLQALTTIAADNYTITRVCIDLSPVN